MATTSAERTTSAIGISSSQVLKLLKKENDFEPPTSFALPGRIIGKDSARKNPCVRNNLFASSGLSLRKKLNIVSQRKTSHNRSQARTGAMSDLCQYKHATGCPWISFFNICCPFNDLKIRDIDSKMLNNSEEAWGRDVGGPLASHTARENEAIKQSRPCVDSIENPWPLACICLLLGVVPLNRTNAST